MRCAGLQRNGVHCNAGILITCFFKSTAFTHVPPPLLSRPARHSLLPITSARKRSMHWQFASPGVSFTLPTPSALPQAMLVNSWVLAIMAAIVAIIIVGKGRIHAAEPLAMVHATDGVAPFTLPVGADSV